MEKIKNIIVVGATGYVGARLVGNLLSSGYRVRAVGRSLENLKRRPWSNEPNLELVPVDVLQRAEIEQACRNCHAAYYLVHSMTDTITEFESRDRIAAENMVFAAEKNSIERIIYLGGLGDPNASLSSHLKSRLEVADILREGTVPTTVLRAAMIIGAGSASFEIMRYLARRLPVMITPRWVRTRSEPIAISNVLGYLTGCLDHPETIGKVFDIGGGDIVNYRQLMVTCARLMGLMKRIIIPVPVLSPKLSSYWIGFVTPVPPSLAKPLILGLKNDMTCLETTIRHIIPQQLLNCRDAIKRAIDPHQFNNCHIGYQTWVKHPEWTMPGDADWTWGQYRNK